MIDALADVRGEVVVNMSAEVPRIGLMIVRSTGEMVGFGVDIFTEVCMIEVLAPVIAFEVVVPVLYAIDSRDDVMIEVLAGTVIDLAAGIGVDMLADMNTNMWAATITAVESIPIPMLTSSEEALLFGWEACSC